MSEKVLAPSRRGGSFVRRVPRGTEKVLDELEKVPDELRRVPDVLEKVSDVLR
ncbi:MAG TPA: hypothetical protein VFF73_21465 [Planctomycetota bacterium]|nr:hypothetical protein [Planctomycetota bacterium]